MICSAWKNGKFDNPNVEYGFRVRPRDRDRYFKLEWKAVIIDLEGDTKPVIAKITQTFWKSEKPCCELRSKDIGTWLIKNGKTPWPERITPKIELEPIAEARFKATFVDN